MKKSSRPALAGITLGLCFALSAIVHPTRAATFNVGCNSADLIAAINTANDNGEVDTINLAPACVYSFTAGDVTNNDSALPRITSTITINGSGATLERDSGAEFRVLFVTGAGNLTLEDVTVSDGDMSAGGGIFNSSTLTLINSSITGNSGGSGGGLYNLGGLTTIIDSTVSGNTADLNGGGIYNSVNSTLTIINSTLSGNSTSDPNGRGGAIYAVSDVTVINSTISGNSVIFGGGGVYLDTGSLSVINSLISGNSANGNGGGIFNEFGVLTVSNGTIPGNIAVNGGGIFNESGTTTLTNSIVWGNGTQINGSANVSYSDVEGGFVGMGNVNVDPLFVGLTDYHLSDGSPVLNSGDNAALPADTFDLDGDLNTAESIPFDRDGNPRVVGGTVDMGAYESQPVELLHNAGFEDDADLDKVPDGWTLLNKSSDKLVCDPAKAHSGNCAFKFKGGAGELADLSQVTNLTGVTIVDGDTLALGAYFNGSNPAVKLKLILNVKYAGEPATKLKVTVRQNAGYTLKTAPEHIVGAGTVEQVKAVFKHKSTGGKIFVDDASLLLSPSGVPRSAILPPPAPPSGFRGRN